MHLLIGIAVLVAAAITPFYLHALIRFHDIVRSEQPGWIERKSSLSFFYEGFPRVFDPNVGLAVLGTAFSRRIYELRSPAALTYARRIRLLLSVGLTLLLVTTVAEWL